MKWILIAWLFGTSTDSTGNFLKPIYFDDQTACVAAANQLLASHENHSGSWVRMKAVCVQGAKQ